MAEKGKTTARKRRQAVDKDGDAPASEKAPGGMPEIMFITDSKGESHAYLRVDDELTLLNAYEDAKESGSGLFEHIGLDPNVIYEEFRAHYDKDGAADIDRAAKDLSTYPPVVARLKEISEKSVSDLLASAELAEARLTDTGNGEGNL